MRRLLLIAVGAGALAVALAVASEAAACVCADVPLEKRLDDADAAVVGTVRGYGEPDVDVPERVLTFDVETRVKGEVPSQVEGADGRRILVTVPFGTDCDVALAPGTTTGLLLTRRQDGGWYASACSVVDAGELVAEGGEPRGGAIKVGLGVVVLGLVLLWAYVRLRRGSRPELPGAPGS